MERIYLITRNWVSAGFAPQDEPRAVVGYTRTEDAAQKWIDQEHPKHRYTWFEVEPVSHLDIDEEFCR